jgi:hypothetical protein
MDQELVGLTIFLGGRAAGVQPEGEAIFF